MANEAYPLDTNGTGWITGGTAPGANSGAAVGQYGNAAASNENYWLPIWSGEVLNAYDQYNIFEPLVTTRAITSGTTMRFPITGTVGHKAQWKAGEELVGSSTISEPRWFDISLDSRPMASFFELDDVSLMLTQWEYRSELARQAGLSLANARDKQIAAMIAQGAFMDARSPAVSKGGNFAGAHDDVTTDLSASSFDMEASATFNYLGFGSAAYSNQRANAALKLLEYIERYMVRLQEIDGPTEGVYVAVTPQAFQDIRALGIARENSTIGNAPANVGNLQPMFGGVAAAGGLGAPYTTGMNALTDSLTYMGATILKTNHIPTATVELGGTNHSVVSSDIAGIRDDLDNVILDPTGATKFAGGQAALTKVTDLGDAKYDFDFMQLRKISDTNSFDAMFPVKALIWQQDAVASLSLQGMKVDTVQDVRRNTQFTVASVMRGAGVLRPELCAAICGFGDDA
tara:strand:- start:5950 stop:7326 length:1377 start_codon:yes stop_codon:yes gene_type:complete